MILGAILAGGAATRLGGGDKGRYEIAGKSIRRRIEDRLAPQVGRVAIIREDRLDIPRGPLRGLHAALCQAEDWAVTVSTDVPFIPHDLVRRLAAAGGPAIAASNGRKHYVVGLWPASLLPRLERALLKENLYRAQDWAALCGAAIVEWDAIPHDPFFNVNTPEDLAEARRIAETAAS